MIIESERDAVIKVAEVLEGIPRISQLNVMAMVSIALGFYDTAVEIIDEARREAQKGASP